MRKHLALLAALSLVTFSGPSETAALPPESSSGEAPKPAEKLEWLAFDAATARAKDQKKHVIVDIYTTWCGWCRVMEQQTYGDPQVAAYLRDNFVLAKVNGESSAKLKWRGRELTERQFARTVGVTGYPATYFLKPYAELLGGMGGFLRPTEFMVYASYVSTRWYEKGKIDAYVAYVDSLHRAGK